MYILGRIQCDTPIVKKILNTKCEIVAKFTYNAVPLLPQCKCVKH